MESTHRREGPGKSSRERLLEGFPPQLAPPSLQGGCQRGSADSRCPGTRGGISTSFLRVSHWPFFPGQKRVPTAILLGQRGLSASKPRSGVLDWLEPLSGSPDVSYRLSSQQHLLELSSSLGLFPNTLPGCPPPQGKPALSTTLLTTFSQSSIWSNRLWKKELGKGSESEGKKRSLALCFQVSRAL